MCRYQSIVAHLLYIAALLGCLRMLPLHDFILCDAKVNEVVGKSCTCFLEKNGIYLII